MPAFLRWRGVTDQRPPTIAILMHRQYLDSIETGMIDDLVARIEKQGAIAMPIFDRMLPKGSLRQLLRPDENQSPLADVIINTQIMLNAEGRRSEFTELGLPVIQANRYRHGDAAWQADAQGLSMMEVPFFLAQPEYAGITDIQISAATRKPHDDVVAIPAQAQAVADRALARHGCSASPPASSNWR
ncbi:cobaltochelatase subunit CobN [Lautropia mirabilis]